jgi:ectoine hydroxylase-related dioxygenase (phytanoyl-CoA dioxygenase family)
VDAEVYAREGFVRLGRILDAAEIEELHGALERALGADPDRSSYGILRHNLWRRSPEFAAALPRLARAAVTLAGSPLTLFQDNLVWKPPGTGDRIEWHQDFAYWPLDEPHGVTVWLALDAVDAENGALRYLPGTHLLGERRATSFVAGVGTEGAATLEPLDAGRREDEAVAVALDAGEALAHHPLVWHMSPGNPSLRERRGWSLTFVGDVRWRPEHAPHPYTHELAPVPGERPAGARFPSFAASATPANMV